MKSQPLKLFVLLFSIAAAAVFVWFSSKKKPDEPAKPALVTSAPDEPDAESGFAVPMPGTMPARVVTDDEVRAQRELMLSSSKSGIIMNDQDIRRMLEVQPPTAQQDALLGSTKNPSRLLKSEDVKQLVEPLVDNKPNEQEATPVNPSTLMPSSKHLDVIFRREDVKKLIEPPAKSNAKHNSEPSNK